MTVNYVWSKMVDVDFGIPHVTYLETKRLILGRGESYGSCAGTATLLGISPSGAATFEITEGYQCPICWHVLGWTG